MRKFVFVALSLFLVVCACTMKTDEEKYQDVEKALMAAVSELTTVPPKVALTSEPYVHGKIAVFQALEKKAAYEAGVYLMQPLYYREMQDNYATRPEEVGTVALVNCQTSQKGVYKADDGKEYPAMVEDCDVTIIDRSQQAVVFKKQFEATPTDERAAIANSVSKQSSQGDIAAFLKGLPKK
jgi:hypothetical protein